MKKFVACLMLAAGTWCLAQPPPNDDFTNRIFLAGSSLTFTGDTTGATIEYYSEPSCWTGVAWYPSVWWSWTPQESSPVIIERLGDLKLPYGYLAVYVGTNYSWDMRTDCQGGIDLGTHGQYFVFNASAGSNYQITLGTPYSGPIGFRLTATNAPVFRLQPRTQTVSLGASALFTSFAVGVKPLFYQWQHEGLDVPDATNQMLALDNASLDDAGDYRVVVTSATGVSTSAVARLIVSTNDSPATLAAVGCQNGQFAFLATGDEGRLYRVFCSADLYGWWGSGVLVNTNVTTLLQLHQDMPVKFVRLAPYHPVSEVCINNLRQIRFAIWQFAEDNHMVDQAAVTHYLLAPYLIGGTMPMCPVKGDAPFYSITDVATLPICVNYSSHRLEEP